MYVDNVYNVYVFALHKRYLQQRTKHPRNIKIGRQTVLNTQDAYACITKPRRLELATHVLLRGNPQCRSPIFFQLHLWNACIPHTQRTLNVCFKLHYVNKLTMVVKLTLASR